MSPDPSPERQQTYSTYGANARTKSRALGVASRGVGASQAAHGKFTLDDIEKLMDIMDKAKQKRVPKEVVEEDSDHEYYDYVPPRRRVGYGRHASIVETPVYVPPQPVERTVPPPIKKVDKYAYAFGGV